MSVIQCLLISIVCAVSGMEFPLYGTQFGWYVLGRPLIGGLICGLILGDLQAGISLGVAVQLVFLAYVTPGGSVPLDISFCAYPALALAISSGMDKGGAVALASVIGMLGPPLLGNFTATVGSFLHVYQDQAIATADIPKYNRCFIVYPQIAKILIRGIPCFFILFWGSQFVETLMGALPDFFLEGLYSLGSVLPAVGIAVLLIQSINEKVFLLFFLLGFIGIVFLNLNIIGLTILSGAFAYLYYCSTINSVKEKEDVVEEDIL